MPALLSLRVTLCAVTGLDARAAAIVMRTVRNIVNTGRTIVCTIHQPSIDIFESFDELLLLKRGGQTIYAGQCPCCPPLGLRSAKPAAVAATAAAAAAAEEPLIMWCSAGLLKNCFELCILVC